MNILKFFIVDEKSLTIIVWKIVKKMLQQFQQTIKLRARYFLCMKIIRNEIQQIKYQSLQTYMNVHFFKNYARSWKLIVVFVVRIQFHKKKQKQRNVNIQIRREKTKLFRRYHSTNATIFQSWYFRWKKYQQQHAKILLTKRLNKTAIIIQTTITHHEFRCKN